MREEHAARMATGGLELALPRQPAMRGKQALNEAIEHEVEKLLFAGEVRVERHRRYADLRGELSDGQSAESVSVREAQGRIDNSML